MNKGDIETRMQLTAALLLQPAGISPAWLNAGDLAGHKRTVERDGGMVLKADKGFQRRIRNLTAQVGVMYEFKLREQTKLNLPMLMAAFNASVNVAQFVVTAPTGTASFNPVIQGGSYLIAGSNVPIVNLNTVVVKVGGTTYTENTDYTIDLASGELYIMPGGGIADGSNVAVTYGCATYATGFDVFSASNTIQSGILSEAGQKVGPVRLFEFDQHAAGGVQRRLHSFNGQYWVEGDDDHDGKKTSEPTLKVLAIDKPAIQILK